MAENLSISMANRGFGANERWTSMNDIQMRTVDYLIVVAGVLLTGLRSICALDYIWVYYSRKGNVDTWTNRKLTAGYWARSAE
jgi:hypothetical protein